MQRNADLLPSNVEKQKHLQEVVGNLDDPNSQVVPGCLSRKRQASTPTDPLPPYKANNHCGETMKGNDGQMYISKKGSNRVCRWVLVEGKRSRSSNGHKSSFSCKTYISRDDKGNPVRVHSCQFYETLDNGGRPFLVTINDYNYVEVSINYEDDPNYGHTVYEGHVEKVFVGDSKPSYDEGHYDWKKELLYC